MSFGGRAATGPTGEQESGEAGGVAGQDVCRLNKAGKLFSCNIDGCCLHSHNEDVADLQAEIAWDMSVTRSASPCVSAAEMNRTGGSQQRDFDSTNYFNIIMSRVLLDMSSFLFCDATHFLNVFF